MEILCCAIMKLLGTIHVILNSVPITSCGRPVSVN